MQDLAYWISPKGKVLEPTLYHVGSIIRDPKKFGESDQSIKDTFDEHGELVSGTSEGNARNEIMQRVMERGFIRVRKYNQRRMQHWSIELYKMSRQKAKYISNWAKHLIDKKLTDDIYADVKVVDIKNFASDSGSLYDLAHDALGENVKITVKDKTVLYECTLTDIANSWCPKDDITIASEGEIGEWSTWISYAGSIDIDTLSERAIVQIYSRKISGGC